MILIHRVMSNVRRTETAEMGFPNTVRSMALISVACFCCTEARADATLTCRYRPAASIEAIGVHQTFTGTIAAPPAVVRTPRPDGPWSGQLQVRISLPGSTVWRDGHSFPATYGPSAVTWKQVDGTGSNKYAVDRVNGDLYHWRNGRIVEGGRCAGTAYPF